MHYLSELVELSGMYRTGIGAYCLMTNHIHLLLYPDSPQSLIKVMKHLGQRHSQWFNKKYDRSGKLWENRYKLQLVDPDYEWVVAKYIDLNPVRAHMIDQAVSYRYSSAEAHVKGIENPFLTKDIVGEWREKFIAFFKEAVGTRDCPRGHVWGSECFVAKMESVLNLRLRFKKVGRPIGKSGSHPSFR